jgi:hypothetical protein
MPVAVGNRGQSLGARIAAQMVRARLCNLGRTLAAARPVGRYWSDDLVVIVSKDRAGGSEVAKRAAKLLDAGDLEGQAGVLCQDRYAAIRALAMPDGALSRLA